MGEKRAPGSYNTAPTMKEAGYSGGEVSTARSVYAPKNLPKPIFDKLVNVFKEAAHSEEYQKFLLAQNSQPLWLTGDEASAYYEKQGVIFKPILAKSGLLKEAN
jgi:tripartite-type tricarboxylate transporter receptor subunit TctC